MDLQPSSCASCRSARTARRRCAADAARGARDRGDAPRPSRHGAEGDVFARTSTTGCASSRFALPPLRDRASDIGVLVEGLLGKITRDLGKGHPLCHAGGTRALAGVSVARQRARAREHLTRAAVLAKGDVLDETALPLTVPTGEPHDADGEGSLPTLREIERRQSQRARPHRVEQATRVRDPRHLAPDARSQDRGVRPPERGQERREPHPRRVIALANRRPRRGVRDPDLSRGAAPPRQRRVRGARRGRRADDGVARAQRDLG